jgi:hypothetical protein
MSETFLTRYSHSNFTQASDLTPVQAQMDGFVSTFVERAMDVYSLGGVVVAGGTNRLVRFGSLTATRSLVNLAPSMFAPISRLSALGAGFISEAIVFDAAPKGARVILGGELTSLNIYGEAGMVHGSIHSAISLFSLKFAGVMGAYQGPIAQNMMQSSAMVTAHHLAARLGIGDAPRESIVHQFVEAQVTVFHLWVGMNILHGLAPGLAQSEQATNLSIHVKEIENRNVGATGRSHLQSIAAVTPGSGIVSAEGITPTRPFTMFRTRKGIESTPPSSPGETSLEELVGLISAGLRADKDPKKQVKMKERFLDLVSGKGIEELVQALNKKKVPHPFAHLEDDIYQTDDQNRSIVELASNALDAGKGDVEIQIKNGFYEVLDRGCGMTPEVIVTRLLIPKLSGKPDPSENIGRFGIGFFTVLRHLKREGEKVIVETRAKGEEAYRLTYFYKKGKIRFKAEKISPSPWTGEEWGEGKTGTRIRIHSSEIQKSSMEAKLDQYLRYVNPKRNLRVNGKKINHPKLQLISEFPFGEEKKGSLNLNPKGKESVLVRVGEVIVEEYSSAGREITGELVIALPQDVALSITRDLVQVDKPVVDFLEKMVGEIKEVSRLNQLVHLFEAFEKRNPPRSVVEVLRKRMREVVEDEIKKDALIKIYPDQTHLPLSPSPPEGEGRGEGDLFIHPHLFNESWWNRFETPQKFQWGETINGQGPGRPIRLVLSEELQKPMHYDSELGVVYLNKELYTSRPSFLLSTLFMVENLRFRVDWRMRAEKGVLETVAQSFQIDSVPISDLEMTKRYLEESDLDWKSFFMRIPGIEWWGPDFEAGESPFHFHGKELLLEVYKNRKAGVINQEGRVIVPFKHGAIFSHSHGEELLFELYNGETVSVINREGHVILPPLEYNSIVCYSHGEELWFNVEKNGKWGVINRKGQVVHPFESRSILFGKKDSFDVDEENEKYGAIDRKGQEVLPFEYDEVYHSLGEELLCLVRLDDFWYFFSYSTLIKIAKNKHLQARVEELRNQHLNLGKHLGALETASEETWNHFLKTAELRPLLHQLSCPIIEHYAKNNLERDASFISRAFRLIEWFRVFVSEKKKEEFLEKIDQILNSRMDVEKALQTIARDRKSRDTEAIELFMKTPGSALLTESKVETVSLPSIPHRLADVITHVRLKVRKTLSGLNQISSYKNEQEERDLHHAIHHLNVSNPYAFVREWLQNSLDVQKRAGDRSQEIGDRREREIQIKSYSSRGKLVVSFRDFGGMTEKELVGLLDPGEGTKRGNDEYRGGFGVGFYSALAEANWVRVKTAVKGSKEILLAEFLVERDVSGKIADIHLRVKKEKNGENFHGTLVESERHADLPQLEAARLEATIRDIAKYISPQTASVSFNDEVVNKGKLTPLVVHETSALGRVELFDGLENRILLGELPLTEIPQELWKEIPEGIKKFYSRLGFYLNLDHKIVKTVKTRDRFRDPAKVLPELKKILPALLIQGFLKRVADPNSPEDLHQLPEVYFVQAYEMAETQRLGKNILTDAEKINAGKLNKVDYEKYASEEEGKRKLLKLLTLLRFLPVGEKGSRKISLRELHQLYQKAIQGDSRAKGLLEKIKKSGVLPHSINERLKIAEGHRIYSEAAEQELEETKIFKAEQLYQVKEIEDPATRLYLKLLQRVTVDLYSHFRNGNVEVGIHTKKNWIGAYAYHFSQGQDYYLYRSLGPALERDVQRLKEILSEKDETKARREFDRYLAELFEVVGHELTHVLTERPDNPGFTHDPHFYQDQMEKILPLPQIPKDWAEKVFNDMWMRVEDEIK